MNTKNTNKQEILSTKSLHRFIQSVLPFPLHIGIAVRPILGWSAPVVGVLKPPQKLPSRCLFRGILTGQDDNFPSTCSCYCAPRLSDFCELVWVTSIVTEGDFHKITKFSIYDVIPQRSQRFYVFLKIFKNQNPHRETLHFWRKNRK